jgi:hypothetical protein
MGAARGPTPRAASTPAKPSTSHHPAPVAGQLTVQTQPPSSVAFVVRRWTKKLAKTDAQQPTPGSNPTGNLRLTKARHAIDWRTFFREHLFGDADWQESADNFGNAIDVAYVDFGVEFDGEDMGTHTLRVDHAPHRESGQGNHVTVLHWDHLITGLQQRNFVDFYVAIEKMSDSTYRLSITKADPGVVL